MQAERCSKANVIEVGMLQTKQVDTDILKQGLEFCGVWCTGDIVRSMSYQSCWQVSLRILYYVASPVSCKMYQLHSCTHTNTTNTAITTTPTTTSIMTNKSVYKYDQIPC